MQAVLVTGGAGYVGSHACKALASAGYLPVTYDSLVYGHERAVKWGPFVRGDLADPDLLAATLQEHRIRSVMHFAAYCYVGESVGEPGKYFRNNTANTLLLLEQVHRARIDKFILSSTCSTYGMPQSVPMGEDHVQEPINPYGESKLFIEQILQWYEKAHSLRSFSLRYFNAAGADPDGDIGEDHDPETHLIPLAMQAAVGRRPQLDIFGADYPTPDGTAIRDYIHVTDLADAHVAALQRLEGGAASTALNLGTGKGHSVRAVVAAVERISGRKVPVRTAPRRPGDPHELVARADRAREVLGWSPRLSALDDIVDTAWRWHSGRWGL